MKIKKLTQYYTLKNSNTRLKIISFQHFFLQSHTPINNSQTKNGYKPNKIHQKNKEIGSNYKWT